MRSFVVATTAALALALAQNAAMAAQDSMSSSPNAAPKSEAAGARNQAAEPRAEIMQAQEKLKSEHLYQGAVDGVLGPETEQALKGYQQKSGLQQTGRLDRQTAQKLGISESSGSTVPPATSTTPSSPAPGTQR